MTEAEQPTLADYAEEVGTTDEIDRSNLGSPDDGHLTTVMEIDPFWHGQREVRLSPKRWSHYSLVPPGSVIVVLEPAATERGWPADEPLQRGVYLSGRDDIDKGLPPVPVAIDDDLFRFAAECMLWAAAGCTGTDDIVALSKDHTSLDLIVRGGERRRIHQDQDQTPLTYATSKNPDLYRGFHSIREFPAPHEVYTQANVPRLSLDQLADEHGNSKELLGDR